VSAGPVLNIPNLKEETRNMVTVGGDCHKRTHTLVAVDENGRELGTMTVAAMAAGPRSSSPRGRRALSFCGFFGLSAMAGGTSRGAARQPAAE
jgi:hypothetical protein